MRTYQTKSAEDVATRIARKSVLYTRRCHVCDVAAGLSEDVQASFWTDDEPVKARVVSMDRRSEG